MRALIAPAPIQAVDLNKLDERITRGYSVHHYIVHPRRPTPSFYVSFYQRNFNLIEMCLRLLFESRAMAIWSRMMPHININGFRYVDISHSHPRPPLACASAEFDIHFKIESTDSTSGRTMCRVEAVQTKPSE